MKNKQNNEHPILLSDKVKRQLEILDKYYDIDYEKRSINLELHYEKISDVLDNDVSTKKIPKFNNCVLQRASEIIDSFPLEFKVHLKLKIDDYEGYDIDTAMESFEDSLEMFHYAVYKEKNRNWIMASIFAVIAIIFLFFRIFASKNGIIGENGIIYEILDIVAWVFLWESVTILFLSPSELRSISFKMSRRILSISLIDKDDNVLISVNRNQIVSNWIEESRKDTTGRIILLISGAATFTTGIVSFINASKETYDLITGINNLDQATLAVTSVAIGIRFLLAVLFVIGGIGAISLFCERGPFKKVVPYISYLFLIFDTFLFALILTTFIYTGVTTGEFDVLNLINSIFSLSVSILYFVSYLLIRKRK